jgi:hypothetical protein
MEFAKLKIRNLDKNPQEEFDVLFNPTEYSIEASNTWKEQERIRQKPELQFTGQSLKKLTMELFFDTYEQKEDVRQYTGKVSQLLVADIDESTGKRPPRCELSWAQQNPTGSDFPFVGVLESVRQQFVLFLSNGMPVRAKLSVGFKEYIPPTQQAQKEPGTASFPAQTYTAKAGDTLSAIAGTLWEDPTLWRLLADANTIVNPRLLEPGRVLMVPPIA